MKREGRNKRGKEMWIPPRPETKKIYSSVGLELAPAVELASAVTQAAAVELELPEQHSCLSPVDAQAAALLFALAEPPSAEPD